LTRLGQYKQLTGSSETVRNTYSLFIHVPKEWAYMTRATGVRGYPGAGRRDGNLAKLSFQGQGEPVKWTLGGFRRPLMQGYYLVGMDLDL
jgi:hypothetical protein